MTEQPLDFLHKICGQSLLLMSERCAFWREHKTLLAADLHLGKEGTFRSAGIPLPEGPSAETLERLDRALLRTGATRLIVLGDFFHGTNSVDAFRVVMDKWRKSLPDLTIELVAGSHDRWSGELPGDWKIKVHGEPYLIAPFSLRHYPVEKDPDGYWLAGHLHPGVTLREGKRGAALRLPCFSFGEHGAVLPAFGSFTGFTRVEPQAANHCFAIADHLVARIPFTPDGGDHSSS